MSIKDARRGSGSGDSSATGLQVRWHARLQYSPHFSARELEVLALLRAGRSIREIGVALVIDESIVKAHIGRLLRKVGLNSRIELTMQPFTKIE